MRKRHGKKRGGALKVSKKNKKILAGAAMGIGLAAGAAGGVAAYRSGNQADYTPFNEPVKKQYKRVRVGHLQKLKRRGTRRAIQKAKISGAVTPTPKAPSWVNSKLLKKPFTLMTT